ncbi:MAG: transglycosylase domain-containing protein [Clostridia bacterium]|nr:transglycosylase domain-containing protein [Clostridia bacterium]
MDKKRENGSENQNGEDRVIPTQDADIGEENKKEKKKREKKEYPRLRKAGIIFCSIFLAGMLTVSTIGLYVVKYMSDYINGEVAIDLDEYKANQSQTTILYTLDNDGNEVEIARLHGEENRIWVDLDEIPKDLQNAFIALEDTRFRSHQGVDWRRTIAVLIVPKYDGQGGSTITQQLIKNLTGERDVTYVRKYREILNALNLEKHYSKETILEAYLNTLYLDAGCYGVQTAAEYYFGKDVGELNLAESACIAAITQEPRANNPILNYEKNRDRMEHTLFCMLRDGYITQEEYDEALEYDLVFTTDDDYVASDKKESSDEMITVTEDGNDDDEVQGYYVDYVIESVIEDLMDAYGYTYNEAWKMVYYGGLKIHVAVDMEIQETLEDIYYNRKGFPSSTNSHGEQVQSCMVIMDYEGRVLGIVGQAGEKEGARCLNIATDSKRQPGSAIKPLSVYSYAIDSNLYSWSYPLVLNYGITVNGDRWPTNYGGDPGSPESYETIQQALAPSHNTVPAQILKSVGVSKSYNWLQETFKITSLEESDSDYAPLAVGAMSHGVYAIEMCAAYATFGNSGVYYEPYCYYTVTNSSGSNVYLTHNDSGEQVMEPGTADVMNKLLQTVATASNGTGRAYRVTGFDMFAKTGTTSDEKDRWFIGGTPYYVCSVWMGYSEYAEELDFSKNYCGQLYQTVMNKIHSNLPTKSFEYSDEIVKRSYCTETGHIASAKCASTATGWYKKTNIPSTCTACAKTPEADPNAVPVDGTTAAATTTVAPAAGG